jgi:hypothetical protein
MNWRSLRVARAWAAVGLILGSAVSARAQVSEPAEPVPGADFQADTLGLIEARNAGLLAVSARGQGDDSVQLELRNLGPRRLSVVIPPGLVAAAASGQFQSMGLGSASNAPGAFGQFREPIGSDRAAFRSIPISPGLPTGAVTVPAGESLRLTVPAVCLNFGLPDPTPRDLFELVDVADYTPDVRSQRALRSLATLGTSRAVAQAVAWNVFNGVPFDQMVVNSRKKVNKLEAGLADRFIEALDRSSTDLVDPAYLTEARVFVALKGEGDLAAVADRLASTLDNAHVLGLPARIVDGTDEPQTSGPALYLVVTLSSATDSATVGRVVVKGLGRDGKWVNGGSAKVVVDAPSTSTDGSMLADALDRAIAREFVGVKAVQRVNGGTVVRVENRLPFTLSGLVLNAEDDASAPVDFARVGVGPLRTIDLKVEANAASIGRVELNGL